jgi:hypothetical protein
VIARIAVDVPWPWWASTAGALATALAAALASWRVRRPAVRGALALLAAQCLVAAAVAPFLMPAGTDGMGVAAAPLPRGMAGAAQDAGEIDAVDMGAMGSSPATQTSSALPSAFVVSRSEPPQADGTAVAVAGDGSQLTLTGSGGWDAAGARADGGGTYELADGDGGFERGSWRVVGFVSFLQLPGGGATVPGELKLEVALEGHGNALLTAWSLPAGAEAGSPARPRVGFALVGSSLRFAAPEGGEPAGHFVFSSGPRPEEGR